MPHVLRLGPGAMVRYDVYSSRKPINVVCDCDPNNSEVGAPGDAIHFRKKGP